MTWLLSLLKKILKSKVFWLILVIAIILGWYLIYAAKGPETEYVFEKVKRGDLVQTVSETGIIESASAINLNFKGSGVLSAVNVKEGDFVKNGQILALLESGSLEISARQALANLNMAKANLDKLLAGVSTEELKVSEEQVNNAKIAADNAQQAFNDVQNQSTKGISDSRQNLVNEIDKQIALGRTAMDAIKLIFDNSYLTYQFSVKNTQYGINAHNYYDEAKVRMSFTETAISNLKANDSDENLLAAVLKLSDAQSWIKNALDNTYLGLINTLVGNLYTETLFNADKSNITNQQSIINAGIASLGNYNQTYHNSKLNQDVSFTQAKANLDSAIGAYNLAKAQYELKKAKPRSADVAALQAQVDQAAAAYQLTLKNLDDYTVYAPTDGIITFVNYKVGEQVAAGLSAKPMISMTGESDFQIKVDVPESNIIKIKIGNPVKITLDAYGSDVIFTGQVVDINLAATIIQDVIYYKITVQLDETDKEVKLGMTANVDIETANTINALYLPNRAIKQGENGRRYVEILQADKTIAEVDVEVGIRADQGTEIKRGLSEGQEIILSKKQK